jgi:hypothetical protein
MGEGRRPTEADWERARRLIRIGQEALGRLEVGDVPDWPDDDGAREWRPGWKRKQKPKDRWKRAVQEKMARQQEQDDDER